MTEDKVGSNPSLSGSALQKYQAQKAGHDHEWTILAGRIQSFLTSQSLFATGAALIAISKPEHIPKLKFLAVVGCVIAFYASITIAINCLILRKWHNQIQDLIKKHKSELDGYYMPRKQPDFMHTLSTDIMSVGMCFTAGIAWSTVFFYSLGEWSQLSFMTIFSLTVLWILFIIGIYNFKVE